MASGQNNPLSWRDAFRLLCSCKRGNRDKSKKDSFCSRFIDARVFMPEHQALSRQILISPETFGLPHEIVSIRTKDQFLLMAFLLVHIEQNYNIIPTIVFYHGNGGNIGDCLPLAEKMFTETVCNVLLVEYRGFGFSQGFPSEDGVYTDAEAAVDFVIRRPDLDSYKIILYGISLGGAVAIDMATKSDYKEHIAALILENTFASLEQVVHRITPRLLKPLLTFLELSDKFPSIRKIPSVTAPTLFLSGLKDNFIHPDHMVKLFVECGSEQKRLVCFPDGEHLNTWTAANYGEQIAEFLQDSIGYIPVIAFKPKKKSTMATDQQHEQQENGRTSAAAAGLAPVIHSKQLLSLREALERLPAPKNKTKIATTNVE